ncbi:MAG: toll/interleukin-1 receptor domain-containing protein [bacterium]|nr:toll/interleukin-1 receptor domain-containing protein [bacterium]
MRTEIDIYVSYAHVDGWVVKPLVEDLRQQVAQRLGTRVNLWIDFNNIAPGSDWQDALRSAIVEAKAMLAVVSPAYLESRSKRDEYETFVQSERPILTVVLEESRNKKELLDLLGDRPGYAAPSIRLKGRDERYYSFISDLAHEIADTLRPAEPAPEQVAPQIPPKPSAELPKRQAKGYVFLSYAEEDADFLAKLRAFFGERGYAYWEFESSERDYQKRIDLELEDVISGAVATVSVLSEAWKESTWSLRELFFSQEIGKPVFLLKAKPMPPTLAIAGFPYIDFTKDSKRAFFRLAGELERAGL